MIFKVGDEVNLPFNEKGVIKEIEDSNLDFFPYKVKITKGVFNDKDEIVEFKKEHLFPFNQNNETIMNREDELLKAVAPDMICEQFEYKGVLLQRLNRDYIWYAIYKNQIINYSQYRNDLTSWIDKHQ
ncbi:MAG: hypothetical protein ACOCVF_01185 [bacterium]